MKYDRNAPWLNMSLKLKDDWDDKIIYLAKDIGLLSVNNERKDVVRNITNVLSIICANVLTGMFLTEGCNYNFKLGNKSYPSGEWNPYRVGIRSIRKVFDLLECGGDPFIKISGGNFDRILNKTYPSQFVATTKYENILISMINEKIPSIRDANPITRNTLNYDSYVALYDEIFQLSPLPLLRLRKGSSKRNPEFISFEHTDETLRMEENIKVCNEFLQEKNIDILVEDKKMKYLQKNKDQDTDEFMIGEQNNSLIDLVSGRCLYRVFNNGKFTDGGRFYGGWWLNIDSMYRRYITINDAPTVEVDFSGMQIAMLYARMGLELSGDAYALEGVEPSYRDLIKTTTLKLINATGQMSAPRKSALPSGLTWRELQDAIIQRHAPIAEFLGSGEGIRLQRLDSDIAEDVMMRMMDRGIVTLPVHDSFIVPEENEDELREVMISSYEGRVGSRAINMKRPQSLLDDLMSDRPDLIECDRYQLAMERFHELKQRPEYEGYRRRQEWASGTGVKVVGQIKKQESYVADKRPG